MMIFELTPSHGYSLGVGLFSSMFLMYLAANVGGQRKKAQVPYPYMYAEKAEAEKDQQKKIFNCYQRVHQNTLEMYPLFMVNYAIASIQHPLLAAGCGLLWIVGRYVYAQGYYTGYPEKRTTGVIFFLPALLGLLGASLKTIILTCLE